jgi:hypothetical protein
MPRPRARGRQIISALRMGAIAVPLSIAAALAALMVTGAR